MGLFDKRKQRFDERARQLQQDRFTAALRASAKESKELEKHNRDQIAKHKKGNKK